MSSEKIPSLKKSVGLTLCSIVVLPVLWWFYFDFPMGNITEETRRKFAQIGLLINIIAALSMVVRYLWLNRYKRRLEQIYKIDSLLVARYEYSKHHTYDESAQVSVKKELEENQEPLYQELENYIKFDKVESIHMVIGIAGLIVGTFLQMIAAG